MELLKHKHLITQSLFLGYTSNWGTWGTLQTPEGYTFVGFTAPITNGYHYYANIFQDGNAVRVNVQNNSNNQATIRVQFKAIYIKTGIVS